MKYRISESALHSLKKLPFADKKRIFEKLEFFFNSEKPLEYAKHLHSSELGQYRFRIGEFRVVFDLEKDTAEILVVGNRKDIYK